MYGVALGRCFFGESMFSRATDASKVALAHLAKFGVKVIPQRLVTSAEAAVVAADAGERVILVRSETTPDDVIGMQVSAGILTARGGSASHAAVVARGWGIPAVVGVGELSIVDDAIVVNGHRLLVGESISIDGSTGEIFAGARAVTQVQLPPEVITLLEWADRTTSGRVSIRANADNDADARRACVTAHRDWLDGDNGDYRDVYTVGIRVYDRRAVLAALPARDVPPRDRRPLPMTRAEMEARGWDAVDVVFVTGDAYIDHPSFAMAILHRVLEDAGFRVAILSQPDWKSADPWRQFGKPRLFFAVSAGNMDSMINHYTANRKVRNDDAYSPGGRIGLRPDRATLPYCHRAREAFPGVPVIAGGVEASLRRLAHYDYWSDTVKRSILLDCKADLVVFGMGENPIVEIARRLQAGETVRDLRDMRGVAYRLGASEPAPDDAGTLRLPSFEQASTDRFAFAEMTKIAHNETNPYNARRLVQFCGREAIVVNPPSLFPTDGLLLISAPNVRVYHSHQSMRSSNLSATCVETARRVSRCSAP